MNVKDGMEPSARFRIAIRVMWLELTFLQLFNPGGVRWMSSGYWMPKQRPEFYQSVRKRFGSEPRKEWFRIFELETGCFTVLPNSISGFKNSRSSHMHLSATTNRGKRIVKGHWDSFIQRTNGKDPQIRNLKFTIHHRLTTRSVKMFDAFLIDAKIAANVLSISISTLRKRTKSGQIPHVRMGRRVFYSLPQLKNMVDRQFVEALIPDFLR